MTKRMLATGRYSPPHPASCHICERLDNAAGPVLVDDTSPMEFAAPPIPERITSEDPRCSECDYTRFHSPTCPRRSR